MSYLGTGDITGPSGSVAAGTVQLNRVKNSVKVFSSSNDDAQNITTLVDLYVYASEADAEAAGAAGTAGSKALSKVESVGTYYLLALGNNANDGAGVITADYYKVASFDVEAVSIDGIDFDPYVDSLKKEADGNLVYNGKAQGIQWEDDPTLTTTLAASGTGGTAVEAGDYAYELQPETDYTATVVSMTEPKYYTANISGTGNFSGAKTATFRVEPGYFVTGAANDKDANLIVNGVADCVTVGTASATPAASGASAGTIDTSVGSLGDNFTQAYGSATDPIESVKFGDTPLVRDVDYTVTYTQTKDAAGAAVTGAEAKSAAPKEKGEYTVTVHAINNTRFRVANDTITGTYTIDNGDFTGMTLTAADGTYLGGKAVEPAAADLALVNAAGEDVTDTLGDKYALTYLVRTGAEELAAYKAMAGDDMTEAEALALFDEKYGVTQATPNDTNRTDAYNAWNKAALDSGKPSTAGDYTVTLTPTNGSPYYVSGSTPTITAKFTVAPRVAHEGEALGDLVITMPDDATYGGTVADPVVKMVVDPAAATDADKYATLAKTDGWAVTYSKDGEDVADPETAVGSYDATFAFSANFAGSDDIVKAGGLVVAPEAITELATSMTFGATYFTGNAIVPKPVFDKGGAVTIPDGTEYELVYKAGTGTLDANGQPVGLGDYTVTATFSGNHEGTLTGTLVVSALGLGDTQVQFDLGDGTYTTSYSAVHTGSAVEPGFRVVLNAGQASASDEEPTEILPAAYQASWANNTDVSTTTTAGKATVTVKPSAQYTTQLTGSQTGDFYITTYSLDNISAEPTFLKADAAATEASYAGKALDDLTFKITSSQGDLGLNTDYALVVTNEAGDDLTSTVTAGASNGDKLVTLKGVKDADTYTFAITSGTNHRYAGKKVATFKVNPIELAQSDLKDADSNPAGKLEIKPATATTPVTYDTTEKTETFTITYKDDDAGVDETIVLDSATPSTGESKGYAVEGDKATDAGAHTASFTFSGNYTSAAPIEQTWEIQKFDISHVNVTAPSPYANSPLKVFTTETKTATELDSTRVAAASYKYKAEFTGEKQEPAVQLRTSAGAENDVTKAATFTTFYGKTDAENTNAGGDLTSGPSVTVAGSGNYTGELTAYFAITPVEVADNDKVTIEWGDALAYTGEVVKPVPAIVLDNGGEVPYALKEGTDFRISYDGAPVNAGEKGTANIQFMDNFKYTDPDTGNGVYSYEYEVQKAANADFSAEASETSLIVGGTAQIAVSGAAGVVSYESVGDAVSVDGAGKVTAVKAGTGSVTVKDAGTDNVAGAEKTIAFSVAAKAAQTIAADLASVSVVEGKTATVNVSGAKTALTATPSNANATASVNGGAVTITGVKAGTAAITLKAGESDAYSASNELTVNVTVTAAPAPTPTPVVTKKDNTAKVTVAKGKTKKKAATVKAKKKNKTIKSVVKVTSPQGSVKVANASKNKVAKTFKLTYKSGKINVKTTKKNVVKGKTYAVKAKITVAGNDSYKPLTKTVTFYVKGKK